MVQQLNPEMVDGLRGIFQARYEPNFAWSSACAQHLALPGLRGFWPMSILNSVGSALDPSGNGRTLTLAGNTYFSYDALAPYAYYDGAGDWHLRADEAALDITATETYIQAGVRGLTMGCWCYSETTGTAEALMSKWETVANDRSYMLDVTAGDLFQANVSALGTAASSAANTHAATPRTANTWYHVIMRFKPTVLDIIVNGNIDTAAVAPAAIFSGAADFYIGAYDPGTNPFQGRVSLAFLCAAYLSDAQLFALYHHTRAMFGV